MNRKTVPGREFRRPIMVRSHRESHHSNGITDPNNLQQISATKSAQSGHRDGGEECPLSGVKRTSPFDQAVAANDPKRTWASPELLLRKMAVEPHFVDRR